jgi:hypothetical protein
MSFATGEEGEKFKPPHRPMTDAVEKGLENIAEQ